MPQKKTALVLGSGGARGIAHIGAVKALQSAGFNFSFVAGASAGAIVGAWVALGYGISELEERILKYRNKTELGKLIDFTIPKGSLIKGNKIRQFMRSLFGDKMFSETSIPLRIVATDLATGLHHVFSSGSIVEAVMASISIPGIFPPVEINGRFYIDGGVANPTPSDIVRRADAEAVIAVDLTSQVHNIEGKLTIFNSLMHTYEIVRNHSFDIHRLNNKVDTIYIKPKLRSAIETMKFFDVERFIASGEEAVRQALPKIRKRIIL